MPKLSKFLPIKVQSPNVKEHWSIVSKRNKLNYRLIRLILFQGAIMPALPCRIKLQRQGKRLYDNDNYIAACKGVKDSLASIILDKKRGQDDDNPGITWEYDQVKSPLPGMLIEIDW